MPIDYRKCWSCKKTLPSQQFVFREPNIISLNCQLCDQLNDYKHKNMKWCYKCHMYIDKEEFNDHVHSNIFADSVVDFKGTRKQRDHYYDLVESRIRDGSADCLKKAKDIKCMDELKLEFLLPDYAISTMRNSNIRNAISLLINIGYFKKEVWRDV